MQTHCRSGHELSGDNLLVWTQGRRACRICRNRKSRDKYRENPARFIALSKAEREAHPEKHFARRLARKRQVLTAYGPSQELRCSWPDCDVTDIDMLSLDHINDDGNVHRRSVGSGAAMYRELIRKGFPVGFQTLCMNHQWKKRALKSKPTVKPED